MDVFKLRTQLIQDYAGYASSFIKIQDNRINQVVDTSLKEGAFWPNPLLQLNPAFEAAGTVDGLVNEGLLHPTCAEIFRFNKQHGTGQPLRFHRHQQQAIEIAQQGHNYILTTGTGSGKSLAYIVPIVDHVLRRGSGKGIQAIIVYPMNALANSQFGELTKFLKDGFPEGQQPVSFAMYTGQQDEKARQQILQQPPDILLTNYVMLELIMTRPRERQLIEQARGLRFLVLDELHTYRGRQGADVALLVRRVQERLQIPGELTIQVVGTSATLASSDETTSEATQRQEVASVASQIFGVQVQPEHVIGETLQRTTILELNGRVFTRVLKKAVQQGEALQVPRKYQEFIAHPLSAWLEDTFGVKEQEGRLVRAEPCSIEGEHGAARRLSEITGEDEVLCAAVLQRWLLEGYRGERDPITGQPPFAFRLHQFISPGDTVFTTLEHEEKRHITLTGQKYVPGSRDRVLLPLCFCRECGQEYYTVRLSLPNEDGEPRHVTPRDFRDQLDDEESEAGYLYLSAANPWPEDTEAIVERLPDDWLEEHSSGTRIRSHRRPRLPRLLRLDTQGQESADGVQATYVPSRFMFCLNCGVSYSARQGDYGKLATLNSEGRSSATTLLSLSAVRSLKTSDLDKQAQKLLSFTDNRQDASLQAGHFNDFIEVGLLRSAVYRAVRDAGPDGLSHELIAEKVFDALNLPLEMYASDPGVRFQALDDTQRALREVLGYRIYHDLRRGWRIALPNLEQCGLLEIDYFSLDDVCAAEDVWAQYHLALSTAFPETRQKIGKVLLDYMRRELAIKVDYLDSRRQERIQQMSNQRLLPPWGIDEDERLEYASVLLPRSSRGERGRGNYTYLSSRGGFGMYLRRTSTFAEYDSRTFGKLGLGETEDIIRQLLEGLRVAGLVEVVMEPRDEQDVPGYQVVASAMRWRAGDGETAFHDVIRVPNPPADGSRPNPFFVNFYQEVAGTLLELKAHEHTAQVPYDKRAERERNFRSADLPVLYCSPTMELGVDIAELNVVNMRNVPPTPANYAQRSGRAGRSGQPALVFTYCASGSPHDQYFFKRPAMMVAGAVAPPRLDLNNADLLRAHLHAIWLAETGIDLKDTLKEILDMNGDPPSLALLPEVVAQTSQPEARQKAVQRARHILRTIPDLSNPDRLLETTMQQVATAFDRTCDRWRDLYLAALAQVKAQEKIRLDLTRSPSDKAQAERLRRDALAQIDLLTEISSLAQSDFYSYRYFATEGFLPGYSFPRLPISAFIPARRIRQRDEFLSRPRFLAISEFGPRAVIYHEGSRYLINQIIMPVTGNEDEENGLLTSSMKQCANCGYVHPLASSNPDLCERCGAALDSEFHALLRMQNVVTKRRDRISADEEERFRLGYDIRTGFRFSVRDGRPDVITAEARLEEQAIAKLTYAQTATLWRINLGWSRRKNKHRYGFVLDVERGYWARNEELEEDEADPLSARTKLVIPYVEDSRNCLLFEPAIPMELEQLASLQMALKRAIEARFQLEDNELAVDSLPDGDNPRLLLFYEAAEGGAGVLRRLVDNPAELAAVAQTALEICHFDPVTGADLRRAVRAQEDCEAACYDCLLSYSNQRMHRLLDRQAIREVLLDLAQVTVAASPGTLSREAYYQQMHRLCESDLEREWLAHIYTHGFRLPDEAQAYFPECETRPDFIYERDGAYAAVYVDGPYHDYPQRQARDQQQKDCMEDYGYQVIRFGYLDKWNAIIQANPHVFGGEA